MTKSNLQNPLAIAAAVSVAIIVAIVFAATQDLKTGHNSIIDRIQAQTGSPEVQYAYGVQLRDSGRESAADDAAPWFEKAAGRGYVPAMLALADLRNANADEDSGDEAVKWWEKASAAGNREATRKLGQAYEIGRGTLDPNREMARTLYKKAAEAGDVEAENLYGGDLLDEGQWKDGETWVLRAEKDGSANADATLGNLYYATYSPLKDWNKAALYYGKASNAGISAIMFNYAYMLANGWGTKEDSAEAYKWILISSRVRDKEMRPALDYFRTHLTPAQLHDGESRAAAWVKSHPPVHL